MRNAVVCSAVAVVLSPVAGAISGTNEVSTPSEIVVSATRIDTPASEVASTVTVITGYDIARNKQTTVVDALQSVPGLTTVRTGGPGSPASVFIRGANSEHALVLIDGIQVNDPSSAGRGAALDNLDVANIERIEVLRGPQSGLYGSDAMAGVVNIITKKGTGAPTFTASAEGGSYNTFKETAAVTGGTNGVSYAFSANQADSDGISAAGSRYGNHERDGYHATSLGGRVGVTPDDRFGLDVIARYLKAQTEFDEAGGVGGDSINDLGTEESVYLRSELHANLADSRWRQTLGVSYADHDRTSKSAWGDSTFDGDLLKTDWKHDLYLTDRNIVTAGAEFQREGAKTDTLPKVTADTMSGFLQDQLKPTDELSATLSGRYDNHEAFGSEWTYRAAPQYIIQPTLTRLKATYGTGFKAPSLYQLYAPPTEFGKIGNPDLKPEKVQGWDAGVEQPFGDRLTAGITWFENHFNNLIDFDNGFVNRSRAQTYGLELTSALKATDALTLAGAYTYTHTEDEDTGKELVRRPQHRASLDTDYQWTRKTVTGVEVVYVGKRSDRFYPASMFTPTDVTLSAYALVNLHASYKVRENVELYARVENLFDKAYEEVAGFGTPGLSAYGGVKVTL